MAETEFAAEFETRLAALEKCVTDLSAVMELRTRKLAEIHADAVTSRENSRQIVAMLDEVLPLVRKAAPLLDSPLAKMAQSPAGAVLGRFAGGMRRG